LHRDLSDLLSATEYLQTRAEFRHVSALGFSAGGTAAVLAAAQQPRLEAVVAEGGFGGII
jgi:dienelactone hydrolase